MHSGLWGAQTREAVIAGTGAYRLFMVSVRRGVRNPETDLVSSPETDSTQQHKGTPAHNTTDKPLHSTPTRRFGARIRAASGVACRFCEVPNGVLWGISRLYFSQSCRIHSTKELVEFAGVLSNAQIAKSLVRACRSSGLKKALKRPCPTTRQSSPDVSTHPRQ